mmetsp:Transcript_15842/g.41914  ORF Transcript_15842/g.41914 Transcript_15842/m.41914 type:complete len:236 (+) Transcript_15842:539-1246(+)
MASWRRKQLSMPFGQSSRPRSKVWRKRRQPSLLRRRCRMVALLRSRLCTGPLGRHWRPRVRGWSRRMPRYPSSSKRTLRPTPWRWNVFAVSQQCLATSKREQDQSRNELQNFHLYLVENKCQGWEALLPSIVSDKIVDCATRLQAHIRGAQCRQRLTKERRQQAKMPRRLQSCRERRLNRTIEFDSLRRSMTAKQKWEYGFLRPSKKERRPSKKEGRRGINRQIFKMTKGEEVCS